MTLQQLHYAIVISEMGSINKAAEVLYVSQPSLTSALQELEKSLGITIFNRSGRGVSVTNDGREFLQYAREVYGQYEQLMERYQGGEDIKIKFSVSTQHYSFAIKAFADLVKNFDTSKYEFAIMETKTKEVISDVASVKSEIGILYLSDFNRSAITKLLRTNNLEFHDLIQVRAFAYLHKDHPLAKKKSLTFDELSSYPCLSFDQGDTSSFYFSEEILPTNEYPRIIRTNDRATNLNLMRALNAYTLCSGIISEELNGDEYVAVPYEDDANPNAAMNIGYITRKNNSLSKMGEQYVQLLKVYLDAYTKPKKKSKRAKGNKNA